MGKFTAIYVRVSTQDKQETGLASQKDALIDFCSNHGLSNVKIYEDRISGAKSDRPALSALKKSIFLGEVETVVVWKLDRLSRSLKDGIAILCDWLERGIRIISVANQFDFSGVVGRLIASVLFSISEMERENIRQNIKRGMETARKNGKKIGGRVATIDVDEIERLKDKGIKMSEIARSIGCSRQGLYTAIRRSQENS